MVRRRCIHGQYGSGIYPNEPYGTHYRYGGNGQQLCLSAACHGDVVAGEHYGKSPACAELQLCGQLFGGPISTFTPVPVGGTGPYNFLWDFGDGGISSDSVAAHQFAGTGTYNVTVTAIDANGCQADCGLQITIVVARK